MYRAKQRLTKHPVLKALLSFAVITASAAICADGMSQQSPELPALLRSDSPIVLPDFSYAGYGFGVGEPDRSAASALAVEDFGAIANDELDDSRAILRALVAAHAANGSVRLRFGPGRFVVSEVLSITRSNITIEGAGMGAGGTELYFPRPLRMVDRSTQLDELKRYLLKQDKRQIEPQNNIDLAFSPYSWSGGFLWVRHDPSRSFAYEEKQEPNSGAAVRLQAGHAFEKSMVLTRAGQFKVGDLVRIQWFSERGKDSRLLRELYGDKTEELVSPIGLRLWEAPWRGLVSQITRVEKVDGKRIRIADPLMLDAAADLPAEIAPWQGLENVVLRDFAIRFPIGVSFGHHLEEGWNGIHLSDVYNGWVDSIAIHDADSGILTYNSASTTIKNIVTDGTRHAHYAVHLGNVHGVLVSGLDIQNPVVHALSFNTFCTRSVFQRATVWQTGVIDQHAGVNMQNLIDEVRFMVHAKADPTADYKGPAYALWDGSGASYWQPGHGRYNAHWNVEVVVQSGASADQTVRLTGLDEGPDARIFGVHGNRTFTVDYRPAPYLEAINQRPDAIPSLYDWQLAQRMGKVVKQ